MSNQTNLENIRHSTAHLLAAAVLKLWPETLLTIGPAIENGFYYDFDFKKPITEDDISTIEKSMATILKTWKEFTHREVNLKEALDFYKNNPYKKELINEIADKNEKITFYKIGDFEDLCRGGHSENPRNQIGAFKLLSIAGAYWRGSEKNKMLTRIYGTSFKTEKELDDYLNQLEELKKRDHKKIGRDLELFWFDKSSPGMAYWLPKGQKTYELLSDFIDSKYQKFGYQKVSTPLVNKKSLYETSGHWDHYKENMFISDMSDTADSEDIFALKPMNCPNAMTIFGFTTRSYNDLPLRLAETSLLHRYELSGTLNGLFRIRAFRQDDAHIFIAPEMVKEEFENLMKMTEEIYKPFGIKYKLRLGTRPENFLGEEKDWDHAEGVLREVLKESGNDYFEEDGEGAFYGPKIDILMSDSLGRQWQTGTIQLDIQQPKRFDLSFIDNSGNKKMPYVFHRAILGSFERFIGILIEHTEGRLPIFIAPTQIVLLPISDKHLDHANKIKDFLESQKIRVEINKEKKTLQAKIREATLQKIPYMGIIGDKEIASLDNGDIANSVVSIREEGKDLGQISLNNFIDRLK